MSSFLLNKKVSDLFLSGLQAIQNCARTFEATLLVFRCHLELFIFVIFKSLFCHFSVYLQTWHNVVYDYNIMPGFET